jgi:TatD DNase family protein
MREFDEDRDEVVRRAVTAGLTVIITVGTTLPDSQRAVAIAGMYPPIYAAIGIHPHEAKQIEEGTYDALRVLAHNEKVVAVGEIGRDVFYNLSPRDVQLRRFAEQLDLAVELDMPVIVHDREAHEETLQILRERKGRLCGVLHCFSGDLEMARECVEMGYYISIAGPVTYKKAEQLRDVARHVPLDRLLVETDCPYLAPQPWRGKRNEPAYVVETARFLAELRGMTAGEMERLTEENTRRLFGLGPGASA